MTTQSTSDKKPRRRWFSPRFSLKMLMLAVTAAAVGTAFWWRWPVTQTAEKKQGSSITTETFTYHRGLWGNLIKHGVHREMIDGKLYLEEFYREGLRHGPYRLSSAMGSVTGDYYLGEKDGTWKYEPADYLPPEQRRRAEECWNRGKREVIKRWDHTGKLLYGLEFRNGRLISAENCLSASLLVQRIAEGTLDDQKVVGKRGPGGKGVTITDVLFIDVDLDFAETPLGDVIEELQERYNIPIASRWKPRTIAVKQRQEPWRKPRPKMEELPSVVKEIQHAPITVNEKQEMLLVGFDVILKQLDLALDYRHGVFCVVDAEGATDWKDTTGVMGLHPAADTLLSKQLDAPAKVTYLEPLRNVLRNLAATQEIAVKPDSAGDVDAVLAAIPEQEMVRLFSKAVMVRSDSSSKPTHPLPITWDPFESQSAASDPFQGPPSAAASAEPKQPLPITLRQLLGLLLDQANLHCHEENGVLIIEQLQKVAPTPTDKAVR